MAETRASILRAARPIVLRDGLGGTTLTEWGPKGGISKMTLYGATAEQGSAVQGAGHCHVRVHARGH